MSGVTGVREIVTVRVSHESLGVVHLLFQLDILCPRVPGGFSSVILITGSIIVFTDSYVLGVFDLSVPSNIFWV